MKTTTTTNEAAAAAATGAAVAPETATRKKSASPKQGARKGKKGASKKAAAPKATKKATKKTATVPREGSKAAQVVAMLQRKDGATLTEIMKKMGWQRHTVRGFMAGARKKAGYAVESFKSDNGERTYRTV